MIAMSDSEVKRETNSIRGKEIEDHLNELSLEIWIDTQDKNTKLDLSKN